MTSTESPPPGGAATYFDFRSSDWPGMIERLKARPGKAIAVAVLAIGAVAIIQASRGAAPYSVENIGTMVVVGGALGGIYAILAAGLVVTYATTGILNFATRPSESSSPSSTGSCASTSDGRPCCRSRWSC